jgi:hypothetical protein
MISLTRINLIIVSRQSLFPPIPSLRCLVPACLVALAVAGCASTQFEAAGRTPVHPLCQAPGETVSALVLWGPQWRPNQKAVPEREAAAQRGIEHFFAESGCFSKSHVRRIVDDRPIATLSPAQVRVIAASEPMVPSRVLLITVRELGPIVKLSASLAPVEGGTEVVLEIRSVTIATGEVSADFRSHWQHGGPWVLKGVATLEQDIGSALQAALKPVVVRQ